MNNDVLFWLNDIETRLQKLERMVNEKRTSTERSFNIAPRKVVQPNNISTIPKSKTVMGRVKEKKRYGDGCA